MKFHWKYYFKNTRHYFKFKVYTSSAAGITKVYFVLDNSGPSENHILTFLRTYGLNIVYSSKKSNCGATFKIALAISSQICL